MKPRKPILPYKVGNCIDCKSKGVKLMSKRCFEQPNFCYQRFKQEKQIAKNIIKSRIAKSIKKPKPSLTKSSGSIPSLLKKAVEVFNKYIRQRDTFGGTHFRCISCGNSFSLEVLQAGHYKPSTYSVLRFNELNCHSECEKCNCHDPNHLIGYRKNLIKKIGLANVEWLESHKIAQPHKWDREELIEIINKYTLLTGK